MTGTDPDPAFSVQRTRVSGRRFLAHLIDGVVMTALLIVTLIPALLVAEAVVLAVFAFWLLPGHVLYYVLLQRRHGRTPGKRATGLRVVDAAGNVPDTGALVRRTVPLIIEYFYIFAWIAMMLSPYRQRFGDRWADTYVVAD
jgi:uncharacterized RDD family membrane protein YckC